MSAGLRVPFARANLAVLHRSTALIRRFSRTAAALSLAVLTLPALSACDSFGEPERYIDAGAQPPSVGPLDVSAFAPGQHVTGRVDLTVALDSLAGNVRSVVLTLDGQQVGQRSEPPYAFTLDTQRYADGEHEVAVAVYLTRPRGGLLVLAGAPAVYRATRLVFDSRPPTPVGGLTATLEAGRPRLRWAPSADPNFYAYVVYRFTEWGLQVDGPVAVITDRDRATFLAEPLDEVYGNSVYYSVRVSNRAQESTAPAPAGIAFGTRAIGLNVPTGQTAASPDGRRLYYVSGPFIVEASPETLQPLRVVDAPATAGVYGTPNDVHVDPETGRIYVSIATQDGLGPVLRVIDPASFTAIRSYRMPAGAVRFVLAGQRLVTVDDGGRVVVRDALSFNAIGLLAAGFSAGEAIGVSPDGRSAYVLDRPAGGPARLTRVDVSGATPLVAEQVALESAAADVAVAVDGRLYVLASPALTVLDGQTLQTVRRADVLPAGAAAQAIHLHAGRAYAVYRETVGTTTPSGGGVLSVDPVALGVERQWRVVGVPTGVAFGASGDLLVFTPEATWAIPL